MSEIKFKFKQVRQRIDQADAVLVGAGSGLSADAGLDYTNTRSFAEKHPAMLQYGFTNNLQLMGFDQSSAPGLFWGYYLEHGRNMRFCNSKQPVYQHLYDLVRQKNYFITTTNVDALFLRNGFDTDRIYTPQGDYGRIQCQTPCSDQTWPSEPVINGLLPLVDPETGKLPQKFVPTCPNCGGPVFYNVRGGSWFVDAAYEDQNVKFFEWVQDNQDRRIVLIEIGAGFNTPVWIRWPFEKITQANVNSHLVRINRDHPEVPDAIKNQATCFSHRAARVIEAIAEPSITHSTQGGNS